MNLICRLPSLEECGKESYRELYNELKNKESEFDQWRLVPPHIVNNPEIIDYPVFQFTFEEVMQAYIEEMEAKFEAVKKELNGYRDNFDMRGKDVAYNLYSKYFKH